MRRFIALVLSLCLAAMLAGCGVAFKLICALEMNLRSTTMYNAVKFAANRFGESFNHWL